MVSTRQNRLKAVDFLSDEEDEAPESVSLSQSKSKAQSQTKALRDAEKSAAAKKKEENRKRDAVLKKRAEERRTRGGNRSIEGKMPELMEFEGEVADPEAARLKDRMARAMQDAEDESAGESDRASSSAGGHSVSEDDDEEVGDEFEGFGMGEDVDEDAVSQMGDSEDMSAEASESESEQEEPPRKRTAQNKQKEKRLKMKKQGESLDYLPDDIFKNALSRMPSSSRTTLKSRSEEYSSKTLRKKPKKGTKAKELIVG